MRIVNPSNSLHKKIDENVPIGYLLDQGNRTKPFTKEQTDSMCSGVMVGYYGYTDKRKHEMSLLILGMQELTTVYDSTESTMQNSSSHMCILAPDQV